MKSNYKKLGPYIQQVNVRNKGLSNIPLLGVSIQKVFMPSIANTVGTDMSTYKVAIKNQFAYGPVTSRNGDKISVALLADYNEALVSQAYTVFEIVNHNELLPEYLMMWFQRPEFDRYARYKSHGSAREIFDWEEMCNIELPIPSMAKQKAIVAEYNTIKTRIALNEKLIKSLESTAQSLYKHWFISEHDYKETTLGQFIIPRKGKTIVRKDVCIGEYPVVAGGLYPSCYHNKSNTEAPVITISASGANAGYINLYETKAWVSDASFIDTTMTNYLFFYYVFLKENQNKIFNMQIGTGQPHIYPEHIASLPFFEYPESLISKYNNLATPIFEKAMNIKRQNKILETIFSLILSKMSKTMEK